MITMRLASRSRYRDIVLKIMIVRLSNWKCKSDRRLRNPRRAVPVVSMSFADSAGGEGDSVTLFVIVVVVHFAGRSCWGGGRCSDAGGTVPVIIVGFAYRSRYGGGISLGESSWKRCSCEEEDGGFHFRI
jgi:hypothetical protein